MEKQLWNPTTLGGGGSNKFSVSSFGDFPSLLLRPSTPTVISILLPVAHLISLSTRLVLLCSVYPPYGRSPSRRFSHSTPSISLTASLSSTPLISGSTDSKLQNISISDLSHSELQAKEFSISNGVLGSKRMGAEWARGQAYGKDYVNNFHSCASR
uniref:Uncharacterized protein n=1 Tax=Cucumis melo TaxID=3656 RepID=A0A9I9EHX6_CUCME